MGGERHASSAAASSSHPRNGQLELSGALTRPEIGSLDSISRRSVSRRSSGNYFSSATCVAMILRSVAINVSLPVSSQRISIGLLAPPSTVATPINTTST